MVEGDGSKKRLFGSYDMGLLRQCPCPVWLLKPEAKPDYKNIVAAIDVKDDYPADEQATRRALNLSVLQTAYSLVLAESAELHVVSVWSADHEGSMRSAGFLNRPAKEVDDYVDGVLSQYQKNYDSLLAEAAELVGPDAQSYLTPQVKLLKGEPKHLIPSYANEVNADLVVMGTVARTGIPGFIMGNTAEDILNGLNQSVLAIKPPNFSSPVKA
jgi:nucleotide-binding universal stress UspA family protein